MLSLTFMVLIPDRGLPLFIKTCFTLDEIISSNGIKKASLLLFFLTSLLFPMSFPVPSSLFLPALFSLSLMLTRGQKSLKVVPDRGPASSCPDGLSRRDSSVPFGAHQTFSASDHWPPWWIGSDVHCFFVPIHCCPLQRVFDTKTVGIIERVEGWKRDRVNI